MTYQKRVLCAAVAASLGLSSAATMAAVTVDLGAATGTLKVANTIPSNTTTLGGGGNLITIKTKTGYTGFVAKSTNPVYVKFNLTNGAKFSTDQTLTMRCSGLSGAETETTAGDVGIQAGGGGFNNVTFIVTAVSGSSGAFGASAYCSVSASSGLSISGLSDVSISATIEFTNGLAQDSAAAGSLTLVQYVNPFTGTFSASTATTALVDATSGSDNWLAGNNLTSATAILGFARLDAHGASAVTATLAANADLGDALGASSGSITISGPAIAALKTVGSGSSGVFLSSGAACAAATVGSYSSTGTNSVTFAGLTTANISGGMYVCGLTTGNTNIISTGQLTAAVGGGAQTNVTITFPSAGNIQSVGSNGTTKNAYLVHAASSTQKTSVVRVINNGANSGELFATAYDESGAVCGNASSSLGTINVGQMLAFTSSALETTLGCTPSASTSKYRIVFFGGLTSFKVLNHARDTTGTGFGLSQSQDD